MSHVFLIGNFTLHSGSRSCFKVDCDALTMEDWSALAYLVAARIRFNTVEGVPRGGLAFADALRKYATNKEADGLLIADDVLTTGASMENQRRERKAQGVVAFARGQCPRWVSAIWQSRME